MKKLLFCAVLGGAASVLSIQAQVMEFDLGGQAGPGLSGGNEVPANLSPATGRELLSLDEPFRGINYNSANDTLELFLGWGSHDDVGGVDLTGDATMAHIHGPASETGTAVPLYTLTILPAAEGGRTGFIDQAVVLQEGTGGFSIADQETQLLGGQWYINIHSEAFPGGEIRGQLQPIPEPETYAMIAAFGLLGFGVYRRYKLQTA